MNPANLRNLTDDELIAHLECTPDSTLQELIARFEEKTDRVVDLVKEVERLEHRIERLEEDNDELNERAESVRDHLNNAMEIYA